MTVKKKIIVIIAAAVAAYLLYRMAKKAGELNTPGLNPISGKITSKFGYRTAPTSGASTLHNGVDIAATIGTQVISPWEGTVKKVWNDTTYGGGVSLAILHNNKYRTGYCHLSSTLVEAGETVERGQVIALTGNTGNTTGPHLHFTLTDPSGTKIDPQSMFDFKA